MSYTIKDYPIKAISMDLTEACNLMCKYPCFHFTNAMQGFTKKPRNMDEGLALDVVDWLFEDETSGPKPEPYLDISLWGGEPLLRFPLLRKVVEHARKLEKKTGKKLNLGGTTNVTLFDKEKVDFCAENDVKFLMSIDGPAFVHDQYRIQTNGTGSYKLIEENLPYIMSKWDFLSARSSPAPLTIQYMASSMKFLYERYGIWNLCYSPAYEGNWTEKHLNIARSQLIEIADWMVQLRKDGKRVRMKHLDDIVQRMTRKQTKNNPPCGAGRHYVGIAVDGTIWACHRMHKEIEGVEWKDNEFCLGSIYDGITNEAFRSQFIDWMDLHKTKDVACFDCSLMKTTNCNGGCFATNLDFTGSVFTAPDIECKWVEIQYQASEYMFNRMKEEGLPVFPQKQNQNQRHGMQGQDQCLCYNIFYDEGETITVNKKDERACLCYNLSYAGKNYTNEEIEQLKSYTFERVKPAEGDQDGKCEQENQTQHD
jgi:uncharacterized protein